MYITFMDNNYTNLFVKTKRGVIHFGRAAAYPFIHCGCPPTRTTACAQPGYVWSQGCRR